MRTQNSTRYSRSLTYSATALRSKSMRSGATPNSSMPVGSTWSRHSVRKSWTPGGTEPLASSGCEAGADHVRAGSPTVARTYVRHERRAFPVGALIGLAPILVNPLGLLLVTALLTPLTFQEVAKPSAGAVVEGILASGFLSDTPLLAAIWAYLSLSFALGSVPSREDLGSLPLLLVVFGGVLLLINLLGTGSESVLSPAIYDLSALAAGLYALPAIVAVAAALTMVLAGRAIR